LDTPNERITLRRLIPKSLLKKYHLQSDKEIWVGRTFINNIKAGGFLKWPSLSGAFEGENIPYDIHINGKPIINPLNIFLVKKDREFVYFWMNKNHECLETVVMKRIISMEKLLGIINQEDLLVRVNKSCAVNIYAFQFARLIEGGIKLELRLNATTEERI
jgi:hypothetical protein